MTRAGRRKDGEAEGVVECGERGHCRRKRHEARGQPCAIWCHVVKVWRQNALSMSSGRMSSTHLTGLILELAIGCSSGVDEDVLLSSLRRSRIWLLAHPGGRFIQGWTSLVRNR